MDLNATLIGQMITFAVFVVFTMKFVWPKITDALNEREKKIANGLAAAEKGERDLELARDKALTMIQESKVTCAQLIEQAHQRANHILEEARQNARIEGERIINHAQVELEQQRIQAEQQLQNQVADLALVMAEKIVQHHLDAASHRQLLQSRVTEL